MASFEFTIKDVCDLCGCVPFRPENLIAPTAQKREPGRGQIHTEWTTVAETNVSHSSPDWNFGARPAGVWKITAFPTKGGPLDSSMTVSSGGGFGPLYQFAGDHAGQKDSYYNDMTWRVGTATLDNHACRDRSYLNAGYRPRPEFFPIDTYNVGGFYGRNFNHHIQNWTNFGYGFDEVNQYRNNSVWNTASETGFSETGSFAAGDKLGVRNASGAIFVWMTGVTHLDLPVPIVNKIGTGTGWDVINPLACGCGSGDPGEGLCNGNEIPQTWLRDYFRRHILPHTDGGTIAGRIENITTSQAFTGTNLQTNQQWTIRLHRMDQAKTYYIDNAYNKPISGLRFRRWSGHNGWNFTNHDPLDEDPAGTSRLPCWYTSGALTDLPRHGNLRQSWSAAWTYSAADEGRGAKMDSSWVFPIWSADVTLNESVPPNSSKCHIKRYEADIDLPFAWEPDRDYGDALTQMTHAALIPLTANQVADTWVKRPALGTTGIVREGAWPKWTVRPLFEDGSVGEEMRLPEGAYAYAISNRQEYFLHSGNSESSMRYRGGTGDGGAGNAGRSGHGGGPYVRSARAANVWLLGGGGIIPDPKEIATYGKPEYCYQLPPLSAGSSQNIKADSHYTQADYNLAPYGDAVKMWGTPDLSVYQGCLHYQYDCPATP